MQSLITPSLNVGRHLVTSFTIQEVDAKGSGIDGKKMRKSGGRSSVTPGPMLAYPTEPGQTELVLSYLRLSK